MYQTCRQMRNSKSRAPHEQMKTIQFIQTGSSFTRNQRTDQSFSDDDPPIIRRSLSLTSVPVIVGSVETPIDIPACVK